MLRVLLRDYSGALRADFRREYGVDLLDLYRGELGLLEASDLAYGLPPGSAVWRAEGGPMAWTDEVHFLSAIEYNTHVAYWLKTKDGSKGRNPPEPNKPPKSKSQEAVDERRVKRALAARRKNRELREKALQEQAAQEPQEVVDGPGAA